MMRKCSALYLVGSVLFLACFVAVRAGETVEEAFPPQSPINRDGSHYVLGIVLPFAILLAALLFLGYKYIENRHQYYQLRLLLACLVTTLTCGAGLYTLKSIENLSKRYEELTGEQLIDFTKVDYGYPFVWASLISCVASFYLMYINGLFKRAYLILANALILLAFPVLSIYSLVVFIIPQYKAVDTICSRHPNGSDPAIIICENVKEMFQLVMAVLVVLALFCITPIRLAPRWAYLAFQHYSKRKNMFEVVDEPISRHEERWEENCSGTRDVLLRPRIFVEILRRYTWKKYKTFLYYMMVITLCLSLAQISWGLEGYSFSANVGAGTTTKRIRMNVALYQLRFELRVEESSQAINKTSLHPSWMKYVKPKTRELPIEVRLKTKSSAKHKLSDVDLTRKVAVRCSKISTGNPKCKIENRRMLIRGDLWDKERMDMIDEEYDFTVWNTAEPTTATITITFPPEFPPMNVKMTFFRKHSIFYICTIVVGVTLLSLVVMMTCAWIYQLSYKETPFRKMPEQRFVLLLLVGSIFILNPVSAAVDVAAQGKITTFFSTLTYGLGGLCIVAFWTLTVEATRNSMKNKDERSSTSYVFAAYLLILMLASLIWSSVRQTRFLPSVVIDLIHNQFDRDEAIESAVCSLPFMLWLLFILVRLCSVSRAVKRARDVRTKSRRLAYGFLVFQMPFVYIFLFIVVMLPLFDRGSLDLSFATGIVLFVHVFTVMLIYWPLNKEQADKEQIMMRGFSLLVSRWLLEISLMAYKVTRDMLDEAALRYRPLRVMDDYLHEPTDTYWMVLVNESLKQVNIVIAFRGTVSKTNWKTDTDMARQKVRPSFWCKDPGKIPGLRPCLLHRGFVTSYQLIRKRLLRSVSSIIDRVYEVNPKPIAVYTTGHSLGGSLATLCAFNIACMYPEVSVRMYNFGTPRVGGEDFANMLSDHLPQAFRIVNKSDMVTSGLSLWGNYRHVGREVVISTNGNLIFDPTLLERSLLPSRNSFNDHRIGSYRQSLEHAILNYIDDDSWPPPDLCEVAVDRRESDNELCEIQLTPEGRDRHSYFGSETGDTKDDLEETKDGGDQVTTAGAESDDFAKRRRFSSSSDVHYRVMDSLIVPGLAVQNRGRPPLSSLSVRIQNRESLVSDLDDLSIGSESGSSCGMDVVESCSEESEDSLSLGQRGLDPDDVYDPRDVR